MPTIWNGGLDDRGHVAIIFALVLIPVVGIAALALDYGRASGVKAQLQRAIDAAATEYQDRLHLDERSLGDLVRAHVAANLPRHLGELPIRVALASDRRSMTVDMGATVPTSLLAIVGMERLDVTASATVRHQPRVRPALPPGIVPPLPPLPRDVEGAVADLVPPGRSRQEPMPGGFVPPRIDAGEMARQMRALEQLAGSAGRGGPLPSLSEQEIARELERALETLRRR